MATTNNTILSQQEYKLILEKYLKSDKFKVIKYEESELKACANVIDYLWFSIKINVIFDNKQQQISFLGKSLMNNPSAKKYFSNEANFYKIVLKYSEYYGTNGSCIPILYYARNDDTLLVFENYFQGFAVCNTFDTDHIKLVLQTLAKLHAESISIEEKSPNALININLFKEEVKAENLCAIWFENEIKRLKNVIALLCKTHPEFQKLHDKLEDVVKNSLSLISAHKYQSVLCHGNLCRENILFKYNDKKEPVECKLINFELQQYNSPVFDTLQFIYSVTSLTIRQVSLNEYLQCYYLNLKNKLQSRGMDIHQIIPYNENYDISIYCFLPFVKLYSTCLKISSHFISQKIEESAMANLLDKKEIIECVMELNDLTDNCTLMREDIFQITRNNLKTTDYKLLDHKMVPLGQFSGYLGSHMKLRIDVSVNNTIKKLNLFAKCRPILQSQLELIDDIDAFVKEIFIYQYMVPKMENNGIKLIEDCVVPCYFTRYNHVLVFEDYGIHNYKCLDSRQPFNYDTISIITKKLAKFHASSIILQEKLSEQTNAPYNFIEHHYKELREGYLLRVEGHRGTMWIETGIRSVEHLLNLFYGSDFVSSNPELKPKIKIAFDDMFEKVKASNKYRNVICHGDLWATNVLIKSENGVSTDCRFIDFQLSRYCPPAQDLLALIYLTTTKRLREKHLNSLIESYYQCLSNALADYDYDVRDIISHSNFMESIEYMIPQAICQSVTYHQLIFLNDNIISKFMADEEQARHVLLTDRKELLSYMYKEDAVFKERTKDILEDFLEMCSKYY